MTVSGERLMEMLHLAFPFQVPAGGRVVGVFGVYLDDSGTHNESGLIVVAGYMSNAERWPTFDKEWREALSDFGIARFHASDCANGAPPFDAWTHQQRMDRPIDLIAIVNRHIVMSVATIIPRALYNEHVAQSDRRKLGGPYGLAAVTCGLEIAKVMRMLDADARAAYMYDAGTRGSGEILKSFSEVLKTKEQAARDRYRLATVNFVDNREITPLQAADLLAYEVYRFQASELGISGHLVRHRYVEALRKKMAQWVVLTASNLSGVGAMLSGIEQQKENKTD